MVDEEEGVASDLDLNSLIEGDVDDDSANGDFLESRVEDECNPQIRYYQHLKVSFFVETKGDVMVHITIAIKKDRNDQRYGN